MTCLVYSLLIILQVLKFVLMWLMMIIWLGWLSVQYIIVQSSFTCFMSCSIKFNKY